MHGRCHIGEVCNQSVPAHLFLVPSPTRSIIPEENQRFFVTGGKYAYDLGEVNVCNGVYFKITLVNMSSDKFYPNYWMNEWMDG